jgi:hypothetical protein
MTGTVTCACGQKLRWGTNISGKRQPFNFEVDPTGNRTLDEFGGVHTYKPGDPVPEGHLGPLVPHHATCRYRERYTRKKR